MTALPDVTPASLSLSLILLHREGGKDGGGGGGGEVRGSDSPSARVVPEPAELESLKKRAFNRKKKSQALDV